MEKVIVDLFDFQLRTRLIGIDIPNILNQISGKNCYIFGKKLAVFSDIEKGNGYFIKGSVVYSEELSKILHLFKLKNPDDLLAEIYGKKKIPR